MSASFVCTLNNGCVRIRPELQTAHLNECPRWSRTACAAMLTLLQPSLLVTACVRSSSIRSQCCCPGRAHFAAQPHIFDAVQVGSILSALLRWCNTAITLGGGQLLLGGTWSASDYVISIYQLPCRVREPAMSDVRLCSHVTASHELCSSMSGLMFSGSSSHIPQNRVTRVGAPPGQYICLVPRSGLPETGAGGSLSDCRRRSGSAAGDESRRRHAASGYPAPGPRRIAAARWQPACLQQWCRTWVRRSYGLRQSRATTQRIA